MTVAERWQRVAERVAQSADRAGRDPAEITIVAVSKGQPADLIGEALHAGVTDLGESRAQELKQKIGMVGSGARWHFVGHLQTNKVRNVVGNVDLVHSVDRLGLADAIARAARSRGVEQPVLIEVNISADPAKHGVEPSRAAALAVDADALDGLSVEGLMTIAPLGPAESVRPHFEALADLREQVAGLVPSAVHLSMGMSADFETAIEAGATIVRIGEAIFGPRMR